MNQFFLMVTIAVSSAAICPAQESTPLPFESKQFESKLVGALFDRQVQGELELVEDQKQELKDILESLQAKQKELSRELEDFRGSGASQAELESKRDELVVSFDTEKSSTMREAMKVLLPHQRKRLRQTAVQLMMRQSAKSNRVPTGFLAPEIREYLEIDDTQAERITKKATEIQKTLAEKIRKLTEQAQAELLGELTETQKLKYSKLVGDPIQAGGSGKR